METPQEGEVPGLEGGEVGGVGGVGVEEGAPAGGGETHYEGGEEGYAEGEAWEGGEGGEGYGEEWGEGEGYGEGEEGYGEEWGEEGYAEEGGFQGQVPFRPPFRGRMGRWGPMGPMGPMMAMGPFGAGRFHPYAGFPMGMGMGMGMPMQGRAGPRGPQSDPAKMIKVQPLVETTTEQEVKDAYGSFGEIEKVLLRLNGTPPYCYIIFAKEESASEAIKAKGATVAGNKTSAFPKAPGLNTGGGRGRQVMQYEEMEEPTNGIGMFRLPFDTTEDEMWEQLKPLGAHTVKMIQKDGQFAGYAFAYFDSVLVALEAKTHLSGISFKGQFIDVKTATKAKQQQSAGGGRGGRGGFRGRGRGRGGRGRGGRRGRRG